MSLRLYNTRTRKTENLTPRTPGKVSVYCCGPTPYDVSHGGHGRSAMLPDLLCRHLRASGFEVTYVRNVTDVEDKILKRSKERGEEPMVLAERFAQMYRDDLAALGCAPPTHEPKVSETIGEIVALTQTLVEKGAAYESEADGGKDVWFSVRSFPTYGELSRRSIDDLRAGEGLDERGKAAKEGKRDPLDFALWKNAPTGEWGFQSPWGNGRPGWHIECSAMSEKLLGFGMDIHCGGMDLVFPHHENEIAQSEAAHPGEGHLANIWMHNGFLNVDKQKMAKSLGNFVTMRDCYARNDPQALRYFLLSAHYRVPIEFETEKLEETGRVVFPGLDEAERRVDYLYATWSRLAELQAQKADAKPVKELEALAKIIRAARARVGEALDDDLNAPVALAVVNELAKAANDLADLAQKRKKDAHFVAAAGGLAEEALAALRAIGDVLGFLGATPDEYNARTRAQRLAVRGLDVAAIEAKIDGRRAAREAKDFAKGDALRAELLALGVEIADGVAGTTWRVGI